MSGTGILGYISCCDITHFPLMNLCTFVLSWIGDCFLYFTEDGWLAGSLVIFNISSLAVIRLQHGMDKVSFRDIDLSLTTIS